MGVLGQWCLTSGYHYGTTGTHTQTQPHTCVHMDIQKTKSVREEKEKSQLEAVEEHHDPFHSDIQQTELWLQKTLLLSLNEGIAA